MTTPHSADFVCDVLVAGTGASGLTAAITARKAGLDVLVVEKAPVFGGTTAVSGGTLWIPSSSHARATGLHDSDDDARRYVHQLAGEFFDERKFSAFLKNGPEMVDFLEAETQVKFVVTVRPDYHSDLPGSGMTRSLQTEDCHASILGRDFRNLRPMLPQTMFLGIGIGSPAEMQRYFSAGRNWRSMAFVIGKIIQQAFDVVWYGRSARLTRGNALIARLMSSLKQENVPVWLSSPVLRPIMKDGRIWGAEVSRNGKPLVIHTRRGIILACGGFPQDIERKKENYPPYPNKNRYVSPAPPTNTGDGISFSCQAGGQFSANVANPAAWLPASVIPNRERQNAVFPHFVDRQKAGFIAVTRKGKRFVNEASSYHAFVQAMFNACRGQDEICAYLIADKNTVNRWGIGYVKPFPVPRGHHIRSGYLLRGETLADLARQAEIDAETLEQTVRQFNANARAGIDPEFHRGESLYDQYLGDPDRKDSPNLAPVEEGPFYAVKLVPSELGTFAGILTDEHARVIGENNTAIKGLYAVGNDMMSVMGGSYPGAGITLGPGMTFGFVAGRHIATLDSMS